MVEQRREPVTFEAREDLGGAAQGVAAHERGRDLEKKRAEILEGALGLGRHAWIAGPEDARQAMTARIARLRTELAA